jgi:hypothetical protein
MAGRPKQRTDIATLDSFGESGFIDLIEQGHTLRQCAKHLNVNVSAICKWIDSEPERKAAVAQARSRAAHMLAEQSLEIADGATPETERVDKLRIDTRRWLASRWNPTDYGERQAGVTINIGQQHLGGLRDLLGGLEQQGVSSLPTPTRSSCADRFADTSTGPLGTPNAR